MPKTCQEIEFTRWRLSTRVVLPLMFAPGLFWQWDKFRDLARSIGSAAQKNADQAFFESVGNLGEGMTPIALCLIAMLLWHWPSMALEDPRAPGVKNAQYAGFIAIMAALLLPVVWRHVLISNCLYTVGVAVSDRLPPGHYELLDWEGLCPIAPTHRNLPYAGYLSELTLTLYAVLVLRAAVLWIAHRRLRADPCEEGSVTAPKNHFPTRA